MNKYLLKCDRTKTEALLSTIPVTSELFSHITPHESTIKEKEISLIEDLKTFRLEEALYCASIDLIIDKSEKEIEHIKTLLSEDFGNQSIHLIKKRINLDVLKQVILLDGHHRFSVINKYFIKKENKVPIIFINYKNLKVKDHYYSLAATEIESSLIDYLNQTLIITKDIEDYDISYFKNSKTTYYVIKGDRNLKARFSYRDEVIKKYQLNSSKPPNNKTYFDTVFFAAKAPEKEQLLNGDVFPSKSTWVTPKFNPDLYKGDIF